MPGFVAKAGLADAIVPLSEMADRILERVAVRNSIIARPADVSRVAS
jgi:chemotaxis response regulator CheB